MMRSIYGIEVHGVDVDTETRCGHWHSELDIISIKFKCCCGWFPCSDCHSEIADHEAEVWLISERDEKAILCGVCGHALGIAEYLSSDSSCTACRAKFNPGCAKHHNLYFESD